MAEQHSLERKFKIGKLLVGFDECLAGGGKSGKPDGGQLTQGVQGELREREPGVAGKPVEVWQQLAHQADCVLAGMYGEERGLFLTHFTTRLDQQSIDERRGLADGLGGFAQAHRDGLEQVPGVRDVPGSDRADGGHRGHR